VREEISGVRKEEYQLQKNMYIYIYIQFFRRGGGTDKPTTTNIEEKNLSDRISIYTLYVFVHNLFFQIANDGFCCHNVLRDMFIILYRHFGVRTHVVFYFYIEFYACIERVPNAARKRKTFVVLHARTYTQIY